VSIFIGQILRILELYQTRVIADRKVERFYGQRLRRKKVSDRRQTDRHLQSTLNVLTASKRSVSSS